MQDRPARRGVRVRDLMHRPMFEKAVVVGGAGGLDHLVRHVSVGEVPEVLRSLRGNELVLTTVGPMATAVDPSRARHVEHMAKRNAAAVCIQLPPDRQQLGADIVDAANRHSLPLIVFRETVELGAICQDVEQLVADRHHNGVARLNMAFHRFRALARGECTIQTVLTLLSDLTGGICVYMHAESGTVVMVPEGRFPDPVQLAADLSLLEGGDEPQWSAVRCGGHLYGALRQGVHVLSIPWGCVYVLAAKAFEPEDAVILDHAVAGIAQILLREHVMEDYLLRDETQEVHDILLGRGTPSQGQRFWQRLEASADDLVFVVAVHDPKASARSVLPLVLGEALRREGIRGLVGLVDGSAAAVVVGRDAGALKADLQRTLAVVRSTAARQGAPNVYVGVSGGHEAGSQLSGAYREALVAVHVQELVGPVAAPFFDALGVYTILADWPLSSMQAFVHQQLGPVLGYDREHGTELLKTLDAFLRLRGSRHQTAQALFVHRQTLYQRLQKLAELLGGYMEPDRRLAIEVALRAMKMIPEGDGLP